MKPLAPPQQTVTTRDPKGLKFLSIVEAAFNKAGLSEKEAQRVNDTPGLAELVAEFITKNRVTDQFKNEEVSTDYTYPPEYKGPMSIEDQIKAVAKTWNLDPTQALEFAKHLPELPAGAEGWFAIPRWDKVAKTYGEALEKAMAFLKETRTDNVCNYREGQLGPKYLQQSKHSLQFWEKVLSAQQGDILIVAAQFGLRHRGRSVRRAREVIMDTPGEFALGAFANACMTIVHPERFVRWEQLHLDCGGDEFAPVADGVFSRAPFFSWDDGRLKFYAGYVGDADRRYGSASVFLPQ
jgi:hypothetical protein